MSENFNQISTHENNHFKESITILDSKKKSLGLNPEDFFDENTKSIRLAELIEEKKYLPPSAKIDIYHGINGNLSAVLKILNSEEKGIKQINPDSPCFAIYPVGQFWKRGDAGFKYSIPREKFQFEGEENNPEAQFHIMNNGNVLLINNLDTLPLDKFSGEILRVEDTKDIYADDVNPMIDTSVSPIDTEILPLSEAEKIIESEIINKISEINLERDLSTKSEI